MDVPKGIEGAPNNPPSLTVKVGANEIAIKGRHLNLYHILPYLILSVEERLFAGNATESALATGNTCDDDGDAALAPRPLTPIPGGTSTKSALAIAPGLFFSAAILSIISGLKPSIESYKSDGA